MENENNQNETVKAQQIKTKKSKLPIVIIVIVISIILIIGLSFLVHPFNPDEINGIDKYIGNKLLLITFFAQKKIEQRFFSKIFWAKM